MRDAPSHPLLEEAGPDMKTMPPNAKPPVAGQRGIALILVLTMMVLFTAYVADFTYESQVRFTLASHARDEIRAELMAENGIKQFRLLLEFEQQLIKSIGQQNLQTFLPMMGLSANQSIIVQLTRSMPLPCDAVAMLSGGGSEEDSSSSSTEAESGGEGEAGLGAGMLGAMLGMGGGSGCSVKAEPEATRLYSVKGLKNNVSGLEHPKVQRLVELFESEEFKADLRAENITPEELASNIADWADADTARANGQGYEDNLYNKGEDPYLPKNNDLDSLGELRLVAGINDAIFAKLVKRVTVFEASFSLPVNDPTTLGDIAHIVTSGAWQDTQPNRLDLWKKYVENWPAVGISGVTAPPDTAANFTNALKAALGPVASKVDDTKLNELLGTGSSTGGTAGGTANAGAATRGNRGNRGNSANNMPKVYNITARAQVGDVVKTLRAVIDMNKTPGTILYWRVD